MKRLIICRWRKRGNGYCRKPKRRIPLPAWPLPERFELKLMGKKRFIQTACMEGPFQHWNSWYSGYCGCGYEYWLSIFKQYQGNGKPPVSRQGHRRRFCRTETEGHGRDTGGRGVRIHRLALNLGANQYTLQRCTTQIIHVFHGET